jgi:hypothetical protein
MPWRLELGHVEPYLGDDLLGGDNTDAGDLVQAVDHRKRRAP